MLEEKSLGRPTKYSDWLADKICEQIGTTTNGLHRICAQEGMPCVSTVFNWLTDPNKKSFLDKYTRAKELQAELMFDELLAIADDGSQDTITMQIRNKKGEIVETKEVEDKEWTNRSRLRVDTRKWAMSKLMPKKYGEKLDLTSDGAAIPAPQIIIQKIEDEYN